MIRYTVYPSAAGLALTLALSTAAAAATQIDEQRPLNPDATVRVSNVKGSIEVSTWDRDALQLSGELGEGVEDLVIEGDRASLRIRVELPSDSDDAEPSDLVLQVPAEISLDADGVSADIDISGLSGERLRTKSVSGDVNIDASPKRLSAETVSGDLSARGGREEVELSSVSGDIDARDLSGDLDLSTVSGDADVATGSLTRARVESVSGDIELDVEGLAAGADLELSSVSGDLTVHLPSEASLSVSAQSFSGDVRSDFGSVERDRFGSEQRLEHRLGDGQGTLELESFSGDIRLRQR